MSTLDVVLYAPNVHSGGGLVLLDALIKRFPEKGRYEAFLDHRARRRLSVPVNCVVHWVKATPASRLFAEFKLRSIAKQTSIVFCFHGLPPILPNSAKNYVYLQNRLYVDRSNLAGFKGWTRFRLTLERLVLNCLRSRVEGFIVQTPSMAHLVTNWYASAKAVIDVPAIRVFPFAACGEFPTTVKNRSPAWDFIYVADGVAHKNHRRLLAAWELMAQSGLRPSLALTLSDRDEGLRREIDEISRKAGLKIHDLGHRLPSEILCVYNDARALIYPSLSESLGLPLIEAAKCGLPIVAAELDYVRDVCTPVETFDPTSSVSIARAVKRFLGLIEPVTEMRTAVEFWDMLLVEKTQ